MSSVRNNRLTANRSRSVAVGLLAGMLAAACGSDGGSVDAGSGDASGVPVVLATTSIWADVVTNVTCGNLVTVESIVPFGSDPHSFEPSLADRARMGEADLIVSNGLLLEEVLGQALDAVESEGTPVFAVGDHFATISFGGGVTDDHAEDDHAENDHAEDDHAEDDHGEDEHGEDEHDDDHADHDHSGDDPHIWFDPARVADVLPELGDALVAEAGLDQAEVDGCVADYQAVLLALDAELESMIEAIAPEDRLLVTNHDSLGYFADRYGFDVLGTVIPSSSSLAETNPAELEALAELISDAGVPAIFAEFQSSSDDIEALAARLGNVEIYSLSTGSLGAPDSESGTYVDLLRSNTGAIVEGLSSK